jgi:hypothetical protein
VQSPSRTGILALGCCGKAGIDLAGNVLLVLPATT